MLLLRSKKVLRYRALGQEDDLDTYTRANAFLSPGQNIARSLKYAMHCCYCSIYYRHHHQQKNVQGLSRTAHVSSLN